MKNTVAIYIFKPQKKYAFLDCRYSHLEIEASGSCVCRTVLMAAAHYTPGVSQSTCAVGSISSGAFLSMFSDFQTGV